MKIDVHTHYYPESFFQMIRETPSEFSFVVAATDWRCVSACDSPESFTRIWWITVLRFSS